MKGEKFHKSEEARRAMRMAEIQLSKPDLKACMGNLKKAVDLIKTLMEPDNVRPISNRKRKTKDTDASQ